VRALLMAGGVSLLFSLLLTPVFIYLFRKWQWGQFIRVDGPQSHHVKHGTPTMGGIVIILGSVVGYFVGKLVNGETPTISALLVIFMMVGLGLVGFIDDFLKTHKKRNLGLGGWQKIAGQTLIATVFALLSLQFPNSSGETPATTHFSIVRDISRTNFVWDPTAGWVRVLGIILFVVWIIFLVTSTSNGVNIADGLDGLATGSSIMAIGAYAVIAFWKFNQACGGVRVVSQTSCYYSRDPLDLAVIAAAIVGGLVGFLWYNTSPAQIFMGDTGSLGLGGALAALAILTRAELLLVFLGGLFVIVTGSVIIQRLYFKATGGKRIFLMSPLHHHFELKGWAEITIVVRFWIIQGLCVMGGLGVFYLEFLNR
jgi:phospho-N-acetylmuramoyl-pentapeptide-transferase